MQKETTDIVEETIKLTAADGHVLEAFRAAPKGAGKGGLVVLQEIFGLTDQLKSVVRGYARDGYDTIFPCVYDRVAPGTVIPFSEPDRGRDLAYGLPLDKVMLDVAAAVARVQSNRGVSVLGFCWGGGVIVRAAAELDLRGAIAFYGTRLPTYLDQKPKCRCCSISLRPIRTRRRKSSSRSSRRSPRPSRIFTTPVMPSPMMRGRSTTKPPPSLRAPAHSISSASITSRRRRIEAKRLFLPLIPAQTGIRGYRY